MVTVSLSLLAHARRYPCYQAASNNLWDSVPRLIEPESTLIWLHQMLQSRKVVWWRVDRMAHHIQVFIQDKKKKKKRYRGKTNKCLQRQPNSWKETVDALSADTTVFLVFHFQPQRVRCSANIRMSPAESFILLSSVYVFSYFRQRKMLSWGRTICRCSGVKCHLSMSVKWGRWK
jgi:hypothetical protein